jgi:hypothetical protein
MHTEYIWNCVFSKYMQLDLISYHSLTFIYYYLWPSSFSFLYIYCIRSLVKIFRLPKDIPLFPVSRPYWVATISRQPHTLTVDFSWHFLQLLAPWLNWLPTVGRSVKLLLAFVSTVIPGSGLLEIHDQDFQSLVDVYVFRNGASSESESELLYYWRFIANQLVLTPSALRLTTSNSFSIELLRLWSLCNMLSDERMGLSFTIAAGPRQRSHPRVRVQRDSWPYFTVSVSRLSQFWGTSSRIYIPQKKDGPVISPGTGFPFRRLLRLSGLPWRYSSPPPHGLGGPPRTKLTSLYSLRTDRIENTAYNISSIVAWRHC